MKTTARKILVQVYMKSGVYMKDLRGQRENKTVDMFCTKTWALFITIYKTLLYVTK